MKIGIIIHSHTGNTYSVAEKLQEKLVQGGHKVEMKKLEPVGGEDTNQADISKITFNPLPEVSGYDELVICAPVRAFSISPVLKAFLTRTVSFKDKKVDLFVTQELPYAWLGGNHAISQMKKLCEEKGAIVGKTGIVNWKNKKKNQMIEDVVERLSKR
jgi:flavodoxin